MLEAGCATNELTGNDYGFDIHVLLPAKHPATARKWSMSSDSVLVQVKGGKSFNTGVSLSREMWRFYLRSPVPIYLAVVPSKGDPWIELVDRLAWDLEVTEPFEGSGGAKIMLRRRPEEDCRWDPQLFVEDAILHATLGSRKRRSQVLEWARWREGADAELDFLVTLAELAVSETGDYTQIDDRVAGYLDSLPGLVAHLQGEGVLGSGYNGAPDLASLELAQQIVDGPFLNGAGELATQAEALGRLLGEYAGSIDTRDLVMLANREHYFTSEHWENRQGKE